MREYPSLAANDFWYTSVMTLGKIIFLNGATSSGKTTIAKLLQSKIEEPFWHISIDHLRESGVLPLERFNSGEFNWHENRENFFKGFHLSLRAYVEAGNNLIVEHIIETNEWKDFLIEQFRDIDIFFIGVHCPLEELERREEKRGDRPIGGARKDFEIIHAFNRYDMELDATLSPEQNIELVLTAWKARNGSLFGTN
jgi:chloramphenicol 3-O phosphotransferase